MYSRALMIVAATLTVASATSLATQHSDQAAQRDPATSDSGASRLPSEPGDGAFAAIAEVVAILSDDPETDWTRVDIVGLRDHLVDMNQIVLGASVHSEELSDGLRMRIRTTGRPGEAVARMVPAHGPVLAAETGWRSEVVSEGDRIVWTVTSTDPGSAARIRALGFFGLMVTGDHHRTHHLALARGAAAH